jgi:EgtB-related family protein
MAALNRPDAFNWGQVWEWTASAFAPFTGFVAHPYRDYSRPWFDGRPVLRGASLATSPRMRHPKYRNYFTPERNDIYAGFRSCAI